MQWNESNPKKKKRLGLLNQKKNSLEVPIQDWVY